MRREGCSGSLSLICKMRGFVLSLMNSGGFVKGTLTVYTEEMSTAAGPTLPSSSSYSSSSSSQLTSDQLTVVAASFSSLVFFVVIVILLSIIYRKDPQCCKLRSYQGPHSDMAAPPQYYSSRQTLVGPSYLEQIIDDSSTQQAGQLFYVGLPSSYSLPTLEAPLPRLPSYESVRKKDRQRQIHMMIADRFGLNGPIVTEPPPTYEESLRQSVELPSGLDVSPPPSFSTESVAAHRISCESSSSVLPV